MSQRTTPSAPSTEPSDREQGESAERRPEPPEPNPGPSRQQAMLYGIVGDGLKEVTGVVTDGVAVRNEASSHRARLDELVAASTDHMAMVRQLEEAYDYEATRTLASGEPFGPLPTGDELADELQRYLRDQGS